MTDNRDFAPKREYTVTWVIQLDADSPLAAAELAQKWMKEWPHQWAFEVKHRNGDVHHIDLADEY